MWQGGVGQGVAEGFVWDVSCLIADVAGRYRGGCCLGFCWECRWQCLIAELGGMGRGGCWGVGGGGPKACCGR